MVVSCRKRRARVERAGRPRDRAPCGPDINVGPGDWTGVHLTFPVDKAYPEGWQAYLNGSGEGARFRIWFTCAGKLWLADVRLEPIQDPTVDRWLDGLYLTRPTEWDNPYRFFGWWLQKSEFPHRCSTGDHPRSVNNRRRGKKPISH
jgi:hypothetical protein